MHIGKICTKNNKISAYLCRPQPYNRWTMRGMLDLPNELKVAEEFWDFIGGQGTYQDLLNIFERVGIELRSEIDAYFARYNRQN